MSARPEIPARALGLAVAPALGVRRRGRSRLGAAGLVLSLGPATVVAGLVWALLQPHRVTLLDPGGESFWWLAVQPPLLVVLAGVIFHFAVARGLVSDLREGGS